MKRAHFIVDVQNDFLPGGALGTPGSDVIIPVINRLMDHFEINLASKDWHPSETVHFDKWPPHCVQHTLGAEFPEDLQSDRIDQVFLTGTGHDDDGYSAFEATNEDLEKYLKDRGIDTLYISGLVTEFCVKNTALDAARKGFNTYVIQDAQFAFGDPPEATKEAEQAMKDAGVTFVRSENLAV